MLTAWHVIKDNRPHEEVGIFTSDGKEHLWESKNLVRIKEVDLALLTFKSKNAYKVAQIGNSRSLASGDKVFVSGFPIPTYSAPVSFLRFLKGELIANAKVSIKDGYQLLYSNPTLPGMSGGSVLNSNGELIGIHGRAEIQGQVTSKESDKLIATGTNKAVPINFYQQYISGENIEARTNASSIDDYFALIETRLNDKSKSSEIIYLSQKSIEIEPTSLGYYYLARGNEGINNFENAIKYYSEAILLDPKDVFSFNNRGLIKSERGNHEGAIKDFSRAINIDPNNPTILFNRATSLNHIQDYKKAIKDFNLAIDIETGESIFWNNLVSHI